MTRSNSDSTRIQRFGRWCVQMVLGRWGMLRRIKKKSPSVYRLIRSKQASVRADRDGNVLALRLMFQPLGDADLLFLRDLPMLRQLELLYCPNVTNQTLEHLSTTKDLHVLKLDGTRISGFGLRHLVGHQNLEVLSLDETLTGTTSVDDLNSIPEDDPGKIEILRTSGVGYLGAFPRLRELSLNCRFVGDGAMEGLAKARSLESLIMAGVQVSNEGLKHLYGHPNLKSVLIFGPGLTSEGTEELKQHLPPGCRVT